jgi:hypothetical protein
VAPAHRAGQPRAARGERPPGPEKLGRHDSAAATLLERVERAEKETARLRAELEAEVAQHWADVEKVATEGRAALDDAHLREANLEHRLATLRGRRVVRAALAVGRINPRTWTGR